MRVLMLWKYYPQYLRYFYNKYPSIVNLPFEEHRNKVFDDHFLWTADLSRYISQEGIETEFIIANAESLQKKWSEENNFRFYSEKDWEKEIAMEQIRRFRPDILWITSIFDYFGDFVKRALQYSKKAITWISCLTPKNLDVSGFTTLVTIDPAFLKDKQYLINEVITVCPSFNSEILGKIGTVEKKHSIIFIGGISPAHSKRAEILTYLVKKGVDIKVFGYIHEQRSSGKGKGLRQAGGHILKRGNFHEGVNVLKQTFVKTDYQRNVESIKRIHEGTVFGLDMYRTLAASRIALNVHIDGANNPAGNIRMFETTGVGTCLLTEYAKNVNELFEPEKEILTYRSKEELLEIIQKLLNQKEKVEQIAKSGQERTLKNHTFERVFNDIRPAFDI